MHQTQQSEFMKPRDLFSPEEQRIYSYAAQRLYAGVYHRMARLQRSEVAIINKDLIGPANIPAERLEKVQRQLVTAGLLEITFDPRPGFAVEAKRTVYRWPDQKIEAT